MNKFIPYILVLGAVLLGAAYYLNTEQNAGASPQGLDVPRENSEGMVTVAITYLNPTSSQYGDSLAFQVTLNTHSVNLDLYNPKELAYIRTDNGQVIQPTSWDEAEESGGHHRSGILLFPKTGTTLEKGNFELIMEDLAGIDMRVFSW
ncbi:MAG: hypothetical protein M8353_00960 [ANME-2 cluster archaeon]|nr:hypothetical protein [ANME-2 cluster archaeon]